MGLFGKSKKEREREQREKEYMNKLNVPLCLKEDFELIIRSVYKELHADHETGAADNK